MIKMSYEQLSNTQFQMAMQKLMNRPMKTPEAFRVMHIGKALQAQNEVMRTQFKTDIMGSYSKGGVTGELPTGLSAQLNLPFDALEGKENDAHEAVKGFGKREFTLSFAPITSEFLFSVGEWTPVELQALQPVLIELSLA